MDDDKKPQLVAFLGIAFRERVLFKGALQWPPRMREKKPQPEQETGWGDRLTFALILCSGPVAVMLMRIL